MTSILYRVLNFITRRVSGGRFCVVIAPPAHREVVEEIDGMTFIAAMTAPSDHSGVLYVRMADEYVYTSADLGMIAAQAAGPRELGYLYVEEN